MFRFNVLIIAAFLITVVSNAQVGIGTTTPDPSAILDINSTSAGMLTPRMNTSQRLAIASPATGLLVFDTDLSAFYFFDGSVWQELGAGGGPAVTRNNYKLVRSVADLADELTAGGGSRYLLNTDYLYEINGTINFDFPIELNSAYIDGVDVGEDILRNVSGGPLFVGPTAGSLRNVLVSGNGLPIFNITGTGAENLVFNNTIFSGASAIGTLSNLNVAFFNNTQYVGNSEGFNVSNITSYFMSNVFWTVSNSGTFLTLSGNFDNLQLASGRIVADSGEQGVDVSSNPTILNDATLAQLSFVGGGTLVNGYTAGSYPGFNFTTDWNVVCSGIPRETDNEATANFFSTTPITSGFTQDISNGTPVEVQGGGVFDNTVLFRFRAEGGNNRLVYEGEETRNFLVNASLSVLVFNASNNFYSFQIAKNGVVINDSDTLVRLDNTRIQSVSINTVVSLSTGDFVEVFVQRLSGGGTDTLGVFSENLTIN